MALLTSDLSAQGNLNTQAVAIAYDGGVITPVPRGTQGDISIAATAAGKFTPNAGTKYTLRYRKNTDSTTIVVDLPITVKGDGSLPATLFELDGLTVNSVYIFRVSLTADRI